MQEVPLSAAMRISIFTGVPPVGATFLMSFKQWDARRLVGLFCSCVIPRLGVSRSYVLYPCP